MDKAFLTNSESIVVINLNRSIYRHVGWFATVKTEIRLEVKGESFFVEQREMLWLTTNKAIIIVNYIGQQWYEV